MRTIGQSIFIGLIITLCGCIVEKEVITSDGTGTLTRREFTAPFYQRIRERLDASSPSPQFMQCLDRITASHGAVMAYGMCDTYFATVVRSSEIQRASLPGNGFWNNSMYVGAFANHHLAMMYGGVPLSPGGYTYQQPAFNYQYSQLWAPWAQGGGSYLQYGFQPGYAPQLPVFQPNMAQWQFQQAVSQQMTLFEHKLAQQGDKIDRIEALLRKYLKKA